MSAESNVFVKPLNFGREDEVMSIVRSSLVCVGDSQLVCFNKKKEDSDYEAPY